MVNPQCYISSTDHEDIVVVILHTMSWEDNIASTKKGRRRRKRRRRRRRRRQEEKEGGGGVSIGEGDRGRGEVEIIYLHSEEFQLSSETKNNIYLIIEYLKNKLASLI